MKARSAAAKQKAKRGRPRIEGATREPSGRISRREEPSKLALEARARMHKISLEDAKDQQAGSFLGRLHMAYINWDKERRKSGSDAPQPEMSISTAQYNALLTCQSAHNDYLKATGAPGAQFEPTFGNAADPDAHAKWSKSAIERWQGATGRGGMRGIVYAAQEQERHLNLWAALDLCVLQEQTHPHMVPAIRVLGNAFARSFRKS